MALQDDLFGLVPITIFLGALQVRPMVAVKILKYPVLVLQTSELRSLGRLWGPFLYRGESATLPPRSGGGVYGGSRSGRGAGENAVGDIIEKRW